jgi:hypothetical protein
VNDRFINTVNCSHDLCVAGAIVRYRNPQPAELFIDLTNPEAAVYRIEQVDPPEIVVQPGDVQLIKLPDFPSGPEFSLQTQWEPVQPYHLEIWIEKSTMNDILDPVCRQYAVNLQT